MHVCMLCCGRLFVTPGTVALPYPLSMDFSRQEYWSGFVISYSRGSSLPRDRTCVSCISGWILYHWATWEAHWSTIQQHKIKTFLKSSFKNKKGKAVKHVNMAKISRTVVPSFLSTWDRFHERNFSVDLGDVSGWFKGITFIVHFVSHLMLPLIWQEVLVPGLEVGDPALGNQVVGSEDTSGTSVLQNWVYRPNSSSPTFLLGTSWWNCCHDFWAFCCQGKHIFRWRCKNTHLLGGWNVLRCLLCWGVCFSCSNCFGYIWFCGCCAQLSSGLSSLEIV